MNRSHAIAFLKQRSLLCSLLTVVPIAVGMLALTACVKQPVGDPEKSRVEERFAGIWLDSTSGEQGTLLVLQPYDSRTYLATIFGYRGQPPEITAHSRSDWKSWLTTLGDATFLTMQPISQLHFAGIEEQPPYLVAKLDVVDGGLHLRLVNGESGPAKGADSRDALEAAIREHLDSPALYAGSPTVFRKTDDAALIREVMEAFHSDAW